MSGGAKRLDLHIGSFACSVQGFDDPVEPVQQILRAVQHILEESPDLAGTAINLEPETVEQLIGEISRRAELDEAEVEIVPGLIVVHRGGMAPGAGVVEADPFAADEEAATQEYVNIFAPSGPSDEDDVETGRDDDLAEFAAGPSDDEADASTDDGDGDVAGDDDVLDRNLIADRLGFAGSRSAGGPSAADDIFAAGSGPSDGRIFADPASASGPSGGPSGGGKATGSYFSALPDERGDSGADGTNDAGADDDELTLHLYPGQAEETAEDEGGFTAAGLAESAKATSVPDLMASAAAWMVLIKGQTTFSRKEVISVFETIPGEHENSLQARIKGFGKAVRDGQIVMIEDGVFGLSRKEMERFQRAL